MEIVTVRNRNEDANIAKGRTDGLRPFPAIAWQTVNQVKEECQERKKEGGDLSRITLKDSKGTNSTRTNEGSGKRNSVRRPASNVNACGAVSLSNDSQLRPATVMHGLSARFG